MSPGREFSPTTIPSYTGSPGRDEHLGPLLQVAQRERHHRRLAIGHQHPALPARERPAQGPYSRNRWCIMPVPRVSVRNSDR